MRRLLSVGARLMPLEISHCPKCLATPWKRKALLAHLSTASLLCHPGLHLFQLTDAHILASGAECGIATGPFVTHSLPNHLISAKNASYITTTTTPHFHYFDERKRKINLGWQGFPGVVSHPSMLRRMTRPFKEFLLVL